MAHVASTATGAVHANVSIGASLAPTLVDNMVFVGTLSGIVAVNIQCYEIRLKSIIS